MFNALGFKYPNPFWGTWAKWSTTALSTLHTLTKPHSSCVCLLALPLPLQEPFSWTSHIISSTIYQARSLTAGYNRSNHFRRKPTPLLVHAPTCTFLASFLFPLRNRYIRLGVAYPHPRDCPWSSSYTLRPGKGSSNRTGLCITRVSIKA